jgi:hypothetical protein
MIALFNLTDGFIECVRSTSLPGLFDGVKSSETEINRLKSASVQSNLFRRLCNWNSFASSFKESNPASNSSSVCCPGMLSVATGVAPGKQITFKEVLYLMKHTYQLSSSFSISFLGG